MKFLYQPWTPWCHWQSWILLDSVSDTFLFINNSAKLYPAVWTLLGKSVYGKDTASKAKNILGCYSGSMGVLFYEKGRGQNLMRLSLSVGLADSGHEQREGSCPTWALEDTVAIWTLFDQKSTYLGFGNILHFKWSMNHEVYERSLLKHEAGNMKHYAYCTTCSVNHETRIMNHEHEAWKKDQ
jgi:hypothetical protein